MRRIAESQPDEPEPPTRLRRSMESRMNLDLPEHAEPLHEEPLPQDEAGSSLQLEGELETPELLESGSEPEDSEAIAAYKEKLRGELARVQEKGAQANTLHAFREGRERARIQQAVSLHKNFPEVESLRNSVMDAMTARKRRLGEVLKRIGDDPTMAVQKQNVQDDIDQITQQQLEYTSEPIDTG